VLQRRYAVSWHGEAVADPFEKTHAMHGKSRTDLLIAGQQFGRVARRQLLRAGLGRGAIEHRIRAELLVRVAPGVYATVPVQR
jgi:hypothetical protein